MATESKGKKAGEAPSFLVKKFDMNEVGLRAGRGIVRAGTFLGLQAVGNMESIKTKKIRKHMGWMALVVGLGAEAVLNEENPAAKVASGLAQGLTTWGIVDLTATLVGEETAGKMGLRGLGAPGPTSSLPGEINWFDLADRADRAIEETASMAGPGDENPGGSYGSRNKVDMLAA